MTQVLCTVNNCRWWTEGNICEAPRILVTNAAQRETTDKSISANTHVGSCQDACCRTFRDEARL
ncbi:MAG: DUF1540 domain-containing protein [Limnochordia bacterium]